MKQYPKQLNLKPGTKIRSRRGAYGVVVVTSNRTTLGYKLYRIRYRMKLGGSYTEFLGNGTFTAEELMSCCKIRRSRKEIAAERAAQDAANAAALGFPTEDPLNNPATAHAAAVARGNRNARI